MKIEYKIKGVVLSEWEMYDIKKEYELCCITETLIDMYQLNETSAKQYAYEVRQLMIDHGVSENDVIKAVINKEVTI